MNNIIRHHEYNEKNANPGPDGFPIAFTDEKQISPKNLNKFKKELDTLMIKIIDKEEAEAVRQRTIVQGSPFKGLLLTPGILHQGKLQPKYRMYLSGNNLFIYTFCRDEKNRTWLAGIENHNQIQPTGTREIWVDGSDLTTPAYEYDIKAGVYGNPRLRWGNYIDMPQNYLSKIWKTPN